MNERNKVLLLTPRDDPTQLLRAAEAFGGANGVRKVVLLCEEPLPPARAAELFQSAYETARNIGAELCIFLNRADCDAALAAESFAHFVAGAEFLRESFAAADRPDSAVTVTSGDLCFTRPSAAVPARPKR